MLFPTRDIRRWRCFADVDAESGWQQIIVLDFASRTMWIARRSTKSTSSSGRKLENEYEDINAHTMQMNNSLITCRCHK